MSKILRVSFMTVLLFALCVSSVLALEGSIGGKVLMGTFSMFADESDRYGAEFPLYVLDGNVVLSGVNLGMELITGNSGYLEVDEHFYNDGYSGYSPYKYTSFKLDAAWDVTDQIALLVGSTSFQAALDWNNSETNHYWYEAKGTGFKVGFIANHSISDKLTTTVKYAFLPWVYVEEFYQDDDDLSYEWLGSGHELDAKVAYAISDALKLEGGLKSDIYSGWVSCCEYPADEAVSGLYFGVNYSF